MNDETLHEAGGTSTACIKQRNSSSDVLNSLVFAICIFVGMRLLYSAQGTKTDLRITENCLARTSPRLFFLICPSLTLFLIHLLFCLFKRLTTWLVTTLLLFARRNSSTFHRSVKLIRRVIR